MDDSATMVKSRKSRKRRPRSISDDMEELLGHPWPFAGRPSTHDLSTWTVIDDLPDPLPPTIVEVEIFERFFADLFDELFDSNP